VAEARLDTVRPTRSRVLLRSHGSTLRALRLFADACGVRELETVDAGVAKGCLHPEWAGLGLQPLARRENQRPVHAQGRVAAQEQEAGSCAASGQGA